MAYNFVRASSQRITTASTPITGAPVTLHALARPANTTDNHYILSIEATGSAANRITICAAGGVAGDPIIIQTFNTTNAFASSGTFIQNAWIAAGGVSSAANSRYAYANGTAGSQNTTSLTPTGINGIVISGNPSNTGFEQYMTGDIAEAAIWSVALTDDEITSLSKGFKPYRIRPQSLVFYAPLVRDLIDIKAGLALTNNNSATVAVHPRVY